MVSQRESGFCLAQLFVGFGQNFRVSDSENFQTLFTGATINRDPATRAKSFSISAGGQSAVVWIWFGGTF
jgi:hypothetical protein